MTIKNKDIYDKLEVIHGRINKVFGLTNENGKKIAVLAEHTENQNTRVDKLENSVDGIKKERLDNQKTKNSRSWDREMAKFGGLISIGTGATIGIVLLIARLFLGI